VWLQLIRPSISKSRLVLSARITRFGVKFELEKIYGKINFALWNFEVKDVSIQLGLPKVLMSIRALMQDVV